MYKKRATFKMALFLYMINIPIILGVFSIFVVQYCIFPDESRLCALAALDQNQRNGTIFLVPQQAQPFGFQAVFGSLCDQLRVPDRTGIDADLICAALQHPVKVIDGVDAAAHDLGNVRAAVQTENRDTDVDNGHIDAHHREEHVVTEQQLNDHRRSSEKADVNRAYSVKYFRKRFVFRQNIHPQELHANQY